MEIKPTLLEKFKPLIPTKRFKFVFGGRGGGKTYAIADIIILMMIGFIPFGLTADQITQYENDEFIYHFKPLTILCTREIQNSIKDSVHSVMETRIKEILGPGYTDLFNITRDDIKCMNGSKIIFRGLYRNVTSIQSIPNINICWIEEAQAISQDSLNILMPTIREKKSEIWFSYNPMYDNDAVIEYKNSIDIKHKVEININWEENPFFTEALQIQKDTDYNNDPILAKHTWEGETLKQGINFVMNFNDVSKAINRQIDNSNNDIIIGCDVARMGDDNTVIVKRQGNKVIDIKDYNHYSITQIASELELIANNDKTIKMQIDETGIGGGLVDIMIQKGYKAIGINNGASPKDKEKYPNCISEQWFEFADTIKNVSLPDNKRLISELSNRKYGYDTKARRCIESKDNYKKRAGKSPDFADALLLCFYKTKTIDYNIDMPFEVKRV